MSFLGKLCPKIQTFQFILKFGTWANSNMQNPFFFRFLLELPFLGKHSPTNQNSPFMLKFLE